MTRTLFVSFLIFAACESPPEPAPGFDPWVGEYKRGGQTVRIERSGARHYRISDPICRGYVFVANEGGWLEDRGCELGRVVPSYEDSHSGTERPYRLLRAQFREIEFTLTRK